MFWKSDYKVIPLKGTRWHLLPLRISPVGQEFSGVVGMELCDMRRSLSLKIQPTMLQQGTIDLAGSAKRFSAEELEPPESRFINMTACLAANCQVLDFQAAVKFLGTPFDPDSLDIGTGSEALRIFPEIAPSRFFANKLEPDFLGGLDNLFVALGDRLGREIYLYPKKIFLGTSYFKYVLWSFSMSPLNGMTILFKWAMDRREDDELVYNFEVCGFRPKDAGQGSFDHVIALERLIGQILPNAPGLRAGKTEEFWEQELPLAVAVNFLPDFSGSSSS